MNSPLVPGVYPDPTPVPARIGAVRTDICGFVGFDPRIRDAGSRLLGDAPAGHRFVLNVVPFQLRSELSRRQIEGGEVLLSSSDDQIPIQDGGSIVFALVALTGDPQVRLSAVQGEARNDAYAQAPSDPILDNAIGVSWVRVADAQIRRVGTGVRTTIIPRLPPVACDDWESYQLQLGQFDETDTTPLTRSVRSFFANGGQRCHIAVVRRPDPDDDDQLREAAREFAGVPGAGERDATGFERLLLIDEVAIAAVPDLYTRRALAGAELVLPPSRPDVCFRPCGPASPAVAVRTPETQGAPLFDDALVLEAQRALMLRAGAERWRVQLLLSVPAEFDPLAGDYRSPDHPRALAWRDALEGATDDAGAAATVLYHPWLLAADREGGELQELPPDGFIAGVIARRDLRRGPAIAAANEVLRGAVGLARPVTDTDNAQLYATPAHVNLSRSFPGRGVLLWGARTQSADTWLRYLNVRRGLSAIERRMAVEFRALAFEPGTPTLWFQMTQVALGVLMELFQQGALRGDGPEQAFYVRCDESNNPPDQIALGRAVCEVGVAIAAPAEFIVFRVSRHDALVAVEEAA